MNIEHLAHEGPGPSDRQEFLDAIHDAQDGAERVRLIARDLRERADAVAARCRPGSARRHELSIDTQVALGVRFPGELLVECRRGMLPRADLSKGSMTYSAQDSAQAVDTQKMAVSGGETERFASLTDGLGPRDSLEVGKVRSAASRWSMRTLFALVHAPLVLFALAIFVTSAVVLSTLDRETVRAADELTSGRGGAERVLALGHAARSVWLAGVAGLVGFGAIATALAVFVHRALSARIRRVARYAGQALEQVVPGPLEVVADDALGELELQLGRIVARIAQRDASLREAMARQQNDVDIQRSLAMVDTEEEALETAGETMALLAPGSPVELLLADSSRAHLRLVVASPAAPPPGCTVKSPDGCAAVRSGKTMEFRSSDSLGACPKLRHRPGGACAAVCVPVSVMGRTIGVLHATAPPLTPFASDRVEGLASLAAHMGTRLGVLRVLRSRELQAETDGLTRLNNRRSFEEKAAQLIAAASGPIAVVMCDLDHFKVLNDTAGHDAGDRALRLFSHAFRTSVRPGDLVARYGGEEFVALLPECGAENARRVLERVRETLAAAVARGAGPHFTASFGVSMVPDDGCDLHELLQAADAALYSAKRAGRNRVAFAGDPPANAEDPANVVAPLAIAAPAVTLVRRS